jgi:hypothetical protein
MINAICGVEKYINIETGDEK